MLRIADRSKASTRIPSKTATARTIATTILLATALITIGVPLVTHSATAANPDPLTPGRRYRGDFPDPFVRYVGGVYYAYGTSTGGLHLPVLRSTDLRAWYVVGDALPQTAQWSLPRDTWAPEMIPLGGRYVLFYTTPSAELQRQCISYAVSESATGPFVDSSSGPLICPPDHGGAIDPSPFVDRNGEVSLLYKTEPGSAGAKTRIWNQPLSPDGTQLLGAPAELLVSGASYERTNIEAPSMRIINNLYVLAYSASSWPSARYNTALALCASAMGPCVRLPANPFLSSIASIQGPGGGAFVEDANGKLHLTYHHWTRPHVGYPNGARRMRITEVQVGPTGLALGPTESDLPPVSWAWSIASSPSGGGYTIAASTGAVYTGGDAHFEGSAGGIGLTEPIVGMANTPSGKGYWLVARDGGIFAYGDARYLGSMGATQLNQPIVGIAATPSGKGYWLVARDGGIFAYGDATFYGSTGAMKLNQPIVGMASTPTGAGYWLVASDGGIFTFGDAAFQGSTGSTELNEPIVGIAATTTGLGYWLLARDGGVFTFGDATFYGSAVGSTKGMPASAIAANKSGTGYWILTLDAEVHGFEAPVYTNTSQ